MKKLLEILLIRFKYDKAGSYSYQHLSYFVLCPRVVDKYLFQTPVDLGTKDLAGATTEPGYAVVACSKSSRRFRGSLKMKLFSSPSSFHDRMGT